MMKNKKLCFTIGDLMNHLSKFPENYKIVVEDNMGKEYKIDDILDYDLSIVNPEEKIVALVCNSISTSSY